MRRANTGFFDGLFSLPGGHVEDGECVRQTAIREMREELALTLDPSDLALVGVVHRRSDTNRIDFFLRATRWSGEPVRAEPGKCDVLRWCAPDALPEDTVAYVRDALGRCAATPWVVETGWPDSVAI